MAYMLGQLIGLAILVLVIVGVVMTLTRSDTSWKQKIVGGEQTGSTFARWRPLFLLGGIVVIWVLVALAA